MRQNARAAADPEALSGMNDVEAAKQRFFEALSFLDARDFPSAELRLRDALNFAPRSVSILTNLAVALMQQQKAADALTFAMRACEIDPSNIEALLVVAGCHARAAQYQQALAACDRIIALEPRLAEVHSNRAAALNGLGRHAEALASCDRAIALNPRLANAHNNRGNALAQLQRHEEALLAYDQALRVQPALGEAWVGRGQALARQKRREEALAAFARALELSPSLASAWVGRGNILIDLQRPDEAFLAFTRAIECKADISGGWLGRAIVLSQRGQADEALAAFAKALEIEPDLAEARKERATLYAQLGRYDEALPDLDRAFALRPDLNHLEGERLHARMHLCDWRDFDRNCAHLLSSIAACRPASLPFPVLAIASSPQAQRQCVETYVAEDVGRPPPLWHGERYAHERIRVAYLSPDFREHPIAYLAEGMFGSHDRARFEITALSFGPDDGSETRRRLTRAFDRFVDVRSQSDAQVARLVRSLEIDIAVDLCGYTRHFRPGILAERPAPVQASYLGYPGTMGTSAIDYLIADRVVIAPEHRDAYAEKIVYLPDSYLVNDRTRPTATLPSRADLGLPPDGFVFCCFNNIFKITPDVFTIWMALLRQVEGSVLWLVAGNPTAVANLRHEAAACGVSPDRLVFAPRVGFAAYLARLRRADLFLGTFHYGAHTTASDALWMGLPLVTVCGAPFASRVAASLLTSLGLAELITQSPAEYLALALRLARDPVLLGAIRDKLATNRDTSPLFDVQRFTRHLEAAYMAMWQRSQRNEPPTDIAVDTIA
jgi:protein O-GlcNAc transferase